MALASPEEKDKALAKVLSTEAEVQTALLEAAQAALSEAAEVAQTALLEAAMERALVLSAQMGTDIMGHHSNQT